MQNADNQNMNWPNKLLMAADRIAAGGDISEEDYYYRSDEVDPRLRDSLEGLWLTLRRFDDDADIRAKDADYAVALSKGVVESASELRLAIKWVIWGKVD
jgi:hypothetical protein